MVEMVEEQIVKHDLSPKRLIGDTSYGDGVCRRDLNELGSQVVAPYKAKTPGWSLTYHPSTGLIGNLAVDE